MKTKEHVEGVWRFRWAGGTFIAVQADSGVWEHVPYDMMELPDWVVSSNLDDEGFQMLCRLWVHRAEARDAVAEVAKAHSISVRCYETMGVPNTEATCACGEHKTFWIQEAERAGFRSDLDMAQRWKCPKANAEIEALVNS